MARLILEEDETSPAAYNHLSIRFFFTFGTPCYERIHVRPQYLKVWVNQNWNTRYNLLQGISGPISFVLHWIYVKPRYLKVWLKLEIRGIHSQHLCTSWCIGFCSQHLTCNVFDPIIGLSLMQISEKKNTWSWIFSCNVTWFFTLSCSDSTLVHLIYDICDHVKPPLLACHAHVGAW